MASTSIRDERFHSRAVHRVGDANAGANRDSAIVLDNGHEGLPVRHLGEPSLEAAAKKVGIVVADRRCRHAWRNVAREHIGGPRPDTIHGSVRGKEEEISAVLSRQPPRRRVLGLLGAQVLETPNEIVRKIGTKSAYDALSRPHEIKSRRWATIQLVDGNQASTPIAAVKRCNALEQNVQATGHAIRHTVMHIFRPSDALSKAPARPLPLEGGGRRARAWRRESKIMRAACKTPMHDATRRERQAL
jgi:hypothetical protein